jgi:ubiquinone/menaquinone biosynthesis C-methylase UbiE
MSHQKTIFLGGEGDQWFQRNKEACISTEKVPEKDTLLPHLLEVLGTFPPEECVSLLEIGCGLGGRLHFLQHHRSCTCYGIDPSHESINYAQNLGIAAYVGTADDLPFPEKMFDIVVFGFCLYLCDRDLLFKIAAEADRVLKTPGWLFVKDFYSKTHQAVHYHHKEGMFTYKMDCTTLFTWHPAYTLYSMHIRDHQKNTYTDLPQEYVSTAILRKM